MLHQILYFNFKQPAFPRTAKQTKNIKQNIKKKKNPTAGLKIPQFCVLQFPALLALPTFSVVCQLTDYNKHVACSSCQIQEGKYILTSHI